MSELSHVVVALMKGVVHRADDEALFAVLVDLQTRIRDYVSVIGLDLLLDEAEGCAFLRQREDGAHAQAGTASLPPRLVPRRQLSYPVSLLLALLRRRLTEFDARGGDARLVLRRDEIAELVRVFLAETGNEAKQLDRIDAHLKKVVELGFLRPLRGEGEQFEVQRILKAFVDAQWLHEFEQRLAAYRAHHLDVGDDR
ncbi:MAG: DUF4194 domain-containing protein [Deltaproteobacteria bacterium]|nr:DUF4194 domain-containing protein [Deltaproteobacteria bacterium]